MAVLRPLRVSQNLRACEQLRSSHELPQRARRVEGAGNPLLAIPTHRTLRSGCAMDASLSGCVGCHSRLVTPSVCPASSWSCRVCSSTGGGGGVGHPCGQVAAPCACLRRRAARPGVLAQAARRTPHTRARTHPAVLVHARDLHAAVQRAGGQVPAIRAPPHTVDLRGRAEARFGRRRWGGGAHTQTFLATRPPFCGAT